MNLRDRGVHIPRLQSAPISVGQGEVGVRLESARPGPGAPALGAQRVSAEAAGLSALAAAASAFGHPRTATVPAVGRRCEAASRWNGGGTLEAGVVPRRWRAVPPPASSAQPWARSPRYLGGQPVVLGERATLQGWAARLCMGASARGHPRDVSFCPPLH